MIKRADDISELGLNSLSRMYKQKNTTDDYKNSRKKAIAAALLGAIGNTVIPQPIGSAALLGGVLSAKKIQDNERERRIAEGGELGRIASREKALINSPKYKKTVVGTVLSSLAGASLGGALATRINKSKASAPLKFLGMLGTIGGGAATGGLLAHSKYKERYPELFR